VGAHPADRDDAGFMLLETLLALTIISVVMASVSMFFLQSTAVTRKQADGQAAAQIATAAVEKASLLPGSAVLTGRSQQDVVSQWRAPGVDAHLQHTELVWENPDVAAAASQALPTTVDPVLLGGDPTKFRRSWYVGVCWQPVNGGACVVVAPALQAGRIKMYRIIVAVTWSSKDCSGGLCSHVAATLTIHDQEDPTFQ
jgi:type II secretory pathway pseudopilin PulG